MKRMEKEITEVKRQRDDLLTQMQTHIEGTADMKKENAELKVLTNQLQGSQEEILNKERVLCQNKIIERTKQFEAEVAGVRLQHQKATEKLNAKHKEELRKKDKDIQKEKKRVEDLAKEVSAFKKE